MGTRIHPEALAQPYFVTFITYKRHPLFRDDGAARLFLDTLFTLRVELSFLLLAHSVMPDHIHLVIVPHADVGLARTMQYIKGRFSRLHNDRTGGRGQVWQGRYYETAVRDEAALLRRVDYVEANPVKAGLATVPEMYPFSSAAGDHRDLEAYLQEGAPG